MARKTKMQGGPVPLSLVPTPPDAPATKPAAPTKPPGVDAKDLQRVVSEMVRQGDNISESTADLGNYVKGQIKHFGLDRGALAAIKKASKMEAAKRQSYLSAVIDYAWKMGYFAQLSLFDDVTHVFRRILAEAGVDERAAPVQDGPADGGEPEDITGGDADPDAPDRGDGQEFDARGALN
jgi:hypothetical protein